MRTAVCTGVLVLAALGAGAAPSATVHVERTTVQAHRPFMITIRASGGDVGDPVIPDVDGLRIEKTPRNTSFSMSMVNLSVTRQRELGYLAEATEAGTVWIPAIAVPIGGKQFFTRPVKLTAVEPPPPTAQRPSQPSSPRTAGSGTRRSPAAPKEPARQTEDQLTWDQLVFITSDADKAEAYQGEPVVLRLRVWNIVADGVTVAARHGADARYPDTEGFYATTLKPREVYEERDGWTYKVTEYQQLLFPTVAGTLTIGAWHWECVAQAPTRFGRQRRDYSLDTPPITVTARPLPERPAGFSGAVGAFTFAAEVSRFDAMQGTPVRLTLTIAGQTNPNAIGEPALPRIEGAYVSDPEKRTQTVDGGALVEKTIAYSITPLEAGEMTIPAIAFCYFDPASTSYQTLTRGPFAINVVASAESRRRAVVSAPILLEEGSVDVIGEDILPLVRWPGELRPYRTSAGATTAVVAGPCLGYAGLFLWLRRKRRFERDEGFARDYRAKSRGRKRLKAALESDDPSEELYRALIGFVADKFNVSEAGMTSQDVRQLFEAGGVGADIEATFTKILRACERARYGTARLSAAEVRALTEAALPAMDRLEQACKKASNTPSGREVRA